MLWMSHFSSLCMMARGQRSMPWR
uniref:Uncharacterized protein n=1 Tax=Anguilla anguilla TaxID=7936 RepID=A0A0E9VP60_ANGAN